MLVIKEPVWLEADFVLLHHDQLILEHGGFAGVRDANLLASALAKAQQAWAYEEPQPDLFTLAALHAVGIGRNHPFNDANKRTATFTMLFFLKENDIQLKLDTDRRAELVNIMVDVAQGLINAPTLAAWLRAQPKA
jgi:death on curing protein